MIKVRQERLNSWPLEGTWENPHGRKAIQVHKVLQELLYIKLLENPWEDPLRRDSSVARAQSVTSVFNIKFLEGAWEDSNRREAFQMLEVWQELLLLKIGPLLYIKLLETHERIHSGGIQFKCTKCDKFFNIKFLEGAWEDPHRREAFQMFKVWQELLEIRPLKKQEQTL